MHFHIKHGDIILKIYLKSINIGKSLISSAFSIISPCIKRSVLNWPFCCDETVVRHSTQMGYLTSFKQPLRKSARLMIGISFKSNVIANLFFLTTALILDRCCEDIACSRISYQTTFAISLLAVRRDIYYSILHLHGDISRDSTEKLVYRL